MLLFLASNVSSRSSYLREQIAGELAVALETSTGRCEVIEDTAINEAFAATDRAFVGQRLAAILPRLPIDGTGPFGIDRLKSGVAAHFPPSGRFGGQANFCACEHPSRNAAAIEVAWSGVLEPHAGKALVGNVIGRNAEYRGLARLQSDAVPLISQEVFDERLKTFVLRETPLRVFSDVARGTIAAWVIVEKGRAAELWPNGGTSRSRTRRYAGPPDRL